MKKTFIILPIIAGAIFLSGCAQDSAPTTSEEKSNKAVESTKVNKTEEVMGGLKEMIGMGKTMECVENVEGEEIKTYIQGKTYKSSAVSKEMTITSIFDGETFYSWNTLTKAGTKMTMTCLEELGKNMPEGPSTEVDNDIEFDSVDEMIEDPQMASNCKESSEKIDFSVPTNIDFVDQCLMIKSLNNKMPSMPNIPME